MLTAPTNYSSSSHSSPSPTLLYTINTASSTNGYRFTGPGITATDNNPVFNLYRGFTYIFDNSSFHYEGTIGIAENVYFGLAIDGEGDLTAKDNLGNNYLYLREMRDE